jgi:hypothetical protein
MHGRAVTRSGANVRCGRQEDSVEDSHLVMRIMPD